MLLTEPTILVHFKPIRIVFLVFHCVVIALLAFSACKCDFNSHNGTSRFTEIFFAFTNSRRKPNTVKVNASLGFARIIVPVRNIMLWAKSTCTIYSQGIITGSFAKKKEPFQRYSYYITLQYKGQAFFMPKICVVKRYDPFSLKKEENERYNVFIRLETVGLDVY